MAVRKQCSIQEVLYRYNVTSMDGTTVPADSLWSYEVQVKSSDKI